MNEVSVERAIEVELKAVVVAIGVMGVSTPFVMYPTVETRPKVKMLTDLLPQHALKPQQNVPLKVEHSKTAGLPESSQNVGQDDADPFNERLLIYC